MSLCSVQSSKNQRFLHINHKPELYIPLLHALECFMNILHVNDFNITSDVVLTTEVKHFLCARQVADVAATIFQMSVMDKESHVSIQLFCKQDASGTYHSSYYDKHHAQRRAYFNNTTCSDLSCIVAVATGATSTLHNKGLQQPASLGSHSR